MAEWKYGWKFLNAAGGTNPGTATEFYYTLPASGQKWSDFTNHPSPQPWYDGRDCGANRLHVMKTSDPAWVPDGWYPWYARYGEDDVVGESADTVAVVRLQLRRIRPTTWWRIIRMGRWQNLVGANLSGANLVRANLYRASLVGANLYRANLSGANLVRANLYHASLVGANLYGANLVRANLSGANLSGANLSAIKCDGDTIWPVGFNPPVEA